MEQLQRIVSEFGRRIADHPEQLKDAFVELGGASDLDDARFEAILTASRTGVASRIRDSEAASSERVDEWLYTLTHAGCARTDAVAAIADWGDALGAADVVAIARGLDGVPATKVAPSAEAPSDAAPGAPPVAAPGEGGSGGVFHRWAPALLSGAALVVALAVLIPILAATSARPAAAEVKDNPSGLFPAGDLPLFILTTEQLQQVMPGLTPTEAAPFPDVDSVVTSPGTCSVGWELASQKSEGSSGAYGRTSTDGQYFLISTGRRYGSEAEAEQAFEALKLGPECATFQLSNGLPVVTEAVAADKSVSLDASDPLVVHYFLDSQTVGGAFTLTRLCAQKLNVVACVRLQGPDGSPRGALIAAEGLITDQFVRAQPFEIPAPTGGDK